LKEIDAKIKISDNSLGEFWVNACENQQKANKRK
jgi:hypothetical protein